MLVSLGTGRFFRRANETEASFAQVLVSLGTGRFFRRANETQASFARMSVLLQCELIALPETLPLLFGNLTGIQ